MKKNYFSLLQQYVSFPTISLPGHQNPEAVAQCINFLKNLLEEGGVKVSIWDECSDDGKLNPVVFGSYIKDELLPTVLVYGHYDVVPVKEDEWNITKPFELIEKDGILYGRGSTDNKGQNLIHILTVLDLIEKGTLAYNVKFFIEGNEETGSAGVDKVIELHKEDLKADYILVSDGSIVGTTPVMEASLRGLVNIKVTVKTSEEDLHSGLAGGAVYNSAVEASKLIVSLYNAYDRVVIEGFYKEGNARHTSEYERINANNGGLLEKNDLKKLFKVKELKTYGVIDNPLTAIGVYPTIEVMGFSSGGGENGFRNIIPGTTVFGLNCRIVAGQDPTIIADLVIKHLKENAPYWIDLQTEILAAGNPVLLDADPKLKAHLTNLLIDVYGQKPFDQYVGGGIPVVGHFKDILGVIPSLVPLANDTCSMHGADENISLWCVEKAFAFSELFFTTKFE